ncbi:MAG: DUF1207 domain-containing protein [Thermoguttaceae bacterium]
MSRHSTIFRQVAFCTALSIVCCDFSIAIAQNTLPMANPASSMTSFSSLSPTGIVGADANLSATSYPETNQFNPALSTQDVNSFAPTNNLQAAPTAVEQPLYFEEAWTWQLMPDGLLYKSYLAGQRESRFAGQWVHIRDVGWFWDVTLGGRVGILRYGTTDPTWPEGIQVDIEGAAFPRLNFDESRDLESADFRFGVPLTIRQGPWEGKFAYYHYSSHLGDEYMVRHASLTRINYSRDCLVLGLGLYLNPNLRLYSEADYAYYTDGGSEPWQFQFGAEFSPIEPMLGRGAPFVATNCMLRQDVDFSGNFTAQAGWQWRGESGHLFRIGAQYFNGMRNQGEFYNSFEEQIGLGIWYDY